LAVTTRCPVTESDDAERCLLERQDSALRQRLNLLARTVTELCVCLDVAPTCERLRIADAAPVERR
jgi:hypothetical protein